MKKLALLTLVALFMGSGSLVLAQTTTAAPVVHPHPRIKEVHTRMHDQMLRIREGVKSGKLTKEQAQALIASLKAVRAQMQADFTTNGKKELTDDQLAQLNQMLDANSKDIYGEKHDDSTAPATGSTSTGTAPDSSSTGTGTGSTGTAPSN
jgi:hypothetical protein